MARDLFNEEDIKLVGVILEKEILEEERISKEEFQHVCADALDLGSMYETVEKILLDRDQIN